MSDAVLVALISLAGVIITTIVSGNIIKYRIDQLEKKVDIHNGYAEKFAESGKDIALIQQRLESVEQMIKDAVSR